MSGWLAFVVGVVSGGLIGGLAVYGPAFKLGHIRARER